MGVEVKLISNVAKVIKQIEKAQVARMQKATHEVRNVTLETLSGSRTGRKYYVPGTKRIYTASAPGEPPAQATAGLRKSIKRKVGKELGRVVGYVGTDLDYGRKLEFGDKGQNLAPRPWLKVSFEKVSPKVKEILDGKWF